MTSRTFMTITHRLPSPDTWHAEGLRLRRLPLARWALGALLAVLLAVSIPAGLDARAWRQAAAADALRIDELQGQAVAQFQQTAPGPAAAQATYQLGRGELGATRMPVADGLALGIRRLDVLPAREKATLDSRQVDARPLGPLRNPLLTDTGLPGVPAMVALLLPLVALVLCAGLLQEEREQGRLGLLRVQARHGLGPAITAALGWRWLAVSVVAMLGTLPALALDPGASVAVGAAWLLALAGFCAVWVVLGGLLSWLPVSGATAMLTALGAWLLLTFAVPSGLAAIARDEAPMPSRMAAIVDIRDAQQDSEEREDALARDWYARHPAVPATLPAAWPASFVPRVLEQDRRLRPLMRRFEDSRLRQAAFVERWSWLSPGLALVLTGERLAGTDTASHVEYLRDVEAFEDRWRAFLVPRVMDRRGLSAAEMAALPRFEPESTPPAMPLPPTPASR
ncbi:DUF3526 domain-containing protein [Mitsuaria sp. GD03876]|uniref:DUF3526 domain-containing protein n=1 Tax=Mitsuaria sp. GD03876 TaxID=2975399 RepID=UPI00244859AC|nr:DUF3526 domain-containing protein [Mitsuaria sp. GD03876]MDH0867923.1 DUF3526 domain-containing protein [Mitsuaria sp. GD03876]